MLPETDVPCLAFSIGKTIWQPVPFQVPRANPMTTVLSGDTVCTVAATGPGTATANVHVKAPLVFSDAGPNGSEIVDVGVVGAVVVTVLLLQPVAVSRTSASGTSARRTHPGMRAP